MVKTVQVAVLIVARVVEMVHVTMVKHVSLATMIVRQVVIVVMVFAIMERIVEPAVETVETVHIVVMVVVTTKKHLVVVMEIAQELVYCPKKNPQCVGGLKLLV